MGWQGVFSPADAALWLARAFGAALSWRERSRSLAARPAVLARFLAFPSAARSCNARGSPRTYCFSSHAPGRIACICSLVGGPGVVFGRCIAGGSCSSFDVVPRNAGGGVNHRGPSRGSRHGGGPGSSTTALARASCGPSRESRHGGKRHRGGSGSSTTTLARASCHPPSVPTVPSPDGFSCGAASSSRGCVSSLSVVVQGLHLLAAWLARGDNPRGCPSSAASTASSSDSAGGEAVPAEAVAPRKEDRPREGTRGRSCCLDLLRLGCEDHESDPELFSGSAAKQGLADEDAFEVAVADATSGGGSTAVVSSEVSVADAAPGG